MPKNAGSKRPRGDAWTGIDHAIRAAKLAKNDSNEPSSYQARRKAALTRDSRHNQESQKLRLHTTKTERQVEKLRQRLSAWDDVEEAERLRKESQPAPSVPKKSKKKGPETWKLRGAARPASEVYDFDTRYVDQHAKAHEEACNKAKLSRNILILYKGRMGNDDGPPQPASRNFLALLMQLGHLNLQAKKYKAARAAFVECMELDGTEQPITSARCHLMRLYLEANRPESARRLWERLPNDISVWIRYSAALVEYVSWKLLQEEGSTRESAEVLLAEAIRANVFCAYYLAFGETFDAVMEYTDEIEDADEETLEEAIEYCSSEQRAAWMETEGSVDWLKHAILRVLHRGKVADLTTADLEWEDRLQTLVEEREREDNDGNDDGNDGDEEHDVDMYAGMFRTGMEMLQFAGALAAAPAAALKDEREVRQMDESESDDGPSE